MRPQKALHLFTETDKKKPKYEGKTYAVFEKYDGWYGFLDFPACSIHSRAMREIPALRELSDSIRSKRPNCRGRLIFEILVSGSSGFSETNGILNRKHEQAEEAYLMVHDYLPDFKTDIPFSVRYQYASEIVDRLDHYHVVLAPILNTSDQRSDWQDCAESVWAEGGEGVILKAVTEGYYPEKRNFSLMKIKEELTVDLLVTDLEEGAGRLRGMVGALVLTDKFGIRHTVGSGLSDQFRLEWWENPNQIVGRVVEIKAMKKLADGQYREPRFKAIRWDKLTTEID